MRNNSQNKFRWFYFVGFFLILALPLLNLPPWFSPPDWGKTIIFRSILAILLFIFLYQVLSKKSFSIKTFLPFWLLISLLGIFFLATVFSLDRNFSLWGNSYRSGGFVNFASYIIFAILAFLILEKGDWQKIWNFAILIGVLVSAIAIFQWQGLFEEFLVSFEGRPPATIGGPIFLAIYLLLLSFLTLSFGIKEKSFYKKIFYFGSLILFIFVILLTFTRAAFLGLFIGILYFLFFYPAPEQARHRAGPKKIIWLRVLALIFIILAIYGIYYLNTTEKFPEFIRKDRFLSRTARRFLIENIFTDSRISGWKVSWQALKNRPLLGYGPENFSIGFDKFYDPSLPKIEMMPGGVSSWWDRAHSFVFDIGLTAGVPALIIYLSLFLVLLWQLQESKRGNPDQSLIYHGIQAGFIAYLISNSFNFDVFSTYLISFLLIGYSLTLINLSTKPGNFDNSRGTNSRKLPQLRKYKGVIILLLFVGLVWFIWNYNIKPFQVNTEINLARYESEQGSCQKPLERMEKILPTNTFLDNYLRMRYIEVISKCIKINPEATKVLAQRATDILKENTKIRPYYTRSWILLGSFTNVLIEKEWQTGNQIESELIQNLKKEANNAFEKANQLSPKRQEVFVEWIRTDLLTGEYQKAKEKSQKCIDLNPELGECWWLMGLIQSYLKDFEKADDFIKVAQEKGFNTQSEKSWWELTQAYVVTENYQGLVKTYQQLIKINPSHPQYHASLAAIYKKIGDFENAKKEALKVLELSPEFKEEVEEFLRSLPQ